MYIAEVVCVSVDDRIIDKNDKLDLKKADLVAYSHGEYYALGELLGRFAYSTHKAERLKTRQIKNKARK